MHLICTREEFYQLLTTKNNSINHCQKKKVKESLQEKIVLWISYDTKQELPSNALNEKCSKHIQLTLKNQLFFPHYVLHYIVLRDREIVFQNLIYCLLTFALLPSSFAVISKTGLHL